jgi:hypothetical protein
MCLDGRSPIYQLINAVSLPLPGLHPRSRQHRGHRDHTTIDAPCAPEAAADIEYRLLDDGVGREARRDRIEIRDFAGPVAAGHSDILFVRSITVMINQ